MTPTTEAPLSMAALSQPDVRANPYPLYRRFLTDGTAHWDTHWHTWVVARYADVAAALRDERFSRATREPDKVDGLPAAVREVARRVNRSYTRQILLLDPPDHTCLRRPLAAAFTPRVVESLRGRIQDLVDALLDPARAGGRIEVIGDLAYPLPAVVIAELLGVPPQDRDRFKAWSRAMATDFGTGDDAPPARIARAKRGVAELLDYVHDLVERSRSHPTPGLLANLVSASDRGGGMEAQDVVANCALLLFAGHETTTNLIGNGLLALLRHPDQVDRMRRNPGLLASAIEECARYDTPVQWTWRRAATDLDMGGHSIARGERVLLLLAGANRDPLRFTDPDHFDIARADNRHLAFGHGIHYCLGAALARLEAHIALGTLLRDFPRLMLATDTAAWGEIPGFRGLTSLPVICR